MERKHWRTIQHNWDFLRLELNAQYLLDDLASCLPLEERQRVKFKDVDADKNEILLLSLKSFSNSYEHFLEALKKTDNHIFRHLTSTTESSLKQEATKEQPATAAKNSKSVVRKILLENFIEEDEQSCTLLDVKNTVQHSGDTFDWTEWTDVHLQQFVKDVFADIRCEPGNESQITKIFNLKFKNECQHKNRGAKSDQEAVQTTSKETQNDKLPETCLLQNMDTEELCRHLEPLLEEYNVDISLLKRFKEEEIDGLVFSKMEESHLKENFCDMSLGKRMRLLLARDKLVKTFQNKGIVQNRADDYSIETEESQQDKPLPLKGYFRRFDTAVDETDRYKKGSELEISGLSQNMIIPIRMCIDMNKSESDVITTIARETVLFSDACLNDRTNGTLYFGISPSKSDKGSGQVAGIHINKQKCEEAVRSMIADAFFEDQHEIVFHAIRSTKFIQVDNSESKGTPLYVIEVDVVPNAILVRDEVFFVKGTALGGCKREGLEMYRHVNGSRKQLNEKEIHSYMKGKQLLRDHRLEQERLSSKVSSQPDLRTQILNLYAGGSEVIEDEIEPILMLSPLDISMDKAFIRETLSFIEHFDAKVTFDFDPNSDSKGLYHYLANDCEQVFELLTTDNFDKEKKDFSEELMVTPHNRWILSNGYSGLDKHPLSAFDWKQMRLDGFKEALRLFKIPKNRAIVVIFLFSHKYEALTEASAEILMAFKDQWMVIAENKDIAKSWKSEMISRHVASKEALEQRCVLGMPWRHVDTTFKQLIQPTQKFDCEIPTSTGAFCVLKKRDLNCMTDLEIVSRNLHDNDDNLKDPDSRENIRKKAADAFYHGDQVSWLNLWFNQDHVLKRKQHKVLKEKVRNALDSPGYDDDEKVGVVKLMHHPGAGGTTSAKQILWDLRSEYRCCVVIKITDDTAEQIVNLRNYEDKKKKRPPLILLDSMDEESMTSLLLNLEKCAKLALREENYFPVFCAILLCEKSVNLPTSIVGNIVLLRHDLDRQELAWFEAKNESLKDEFKKHKTTNPNLLMSFNILRTNFDKNYIKQRVEDFMPGLDGKEFIVIKYLSLINSYHIDFHIIPLSCFDPIFEGFVRDDRYIRPTGWESKMSTSLRLLVNKTSNRGICGREAPIRITSALLAEEILGYILRTTEETRSDIFLEMLSSVIFQCENRSTKKLLSIVGNLVKKRRMTGEIRSSLSPMILDISRLEGSEQASAVMTEVFHQTCDAMVAQQIGRFYIINKNWSKAEEYARKATNLLPSNSFLLDTIGQVYKSRMRESYDTARTTKTKLNIKDSNEVLQFASEALKIFRREQQLSEAEKTLINNHGGYINELITIFSLCDTVSIFEIFPGMETFHRFLVDADFVPEEFSSLDLQSRNMLKSLGDSAFKTIRKLEDELVQTKGDSREAFNTDRYLDRGKLNYYKEKAYVFFGEHSKVVPKSLSSSDACEYRRRFVKRIGLTSLHGALDLTHADDHENLDVSCMFMLENVSSRWCSTFDLVTMLHIVLSCHVCDLRNTANITYQNILDWSKQLYNRKQPEDSPYLETYVYLVLFHLPTVARVSNFELCSEVTLQDALEQWKQTFSKKYPKHDDQNRLGAKKGTTLFFLGKGMGLSEIVYQKHLLTDGVKYHDNGFWESALAKQRFQRLEGYLLFGGTEVLVPLQTASGNKYNITIAASKPVRSKRMWQSKIYFVFGFGWSGPKAYDIRLDDLTQDLDETVPTGALAPQQVFPQTQNESSTQLTLSKIENDIKEKEEKLESLKMKKNGSKQRAKKRKLEADLKDLYKDQRRLLWDADKG
ncbi:sterile alpha motif domain-containing protein 9-like [Haliotis cracherodii]|uniref:sterile alpha motif domain-containing protein 9-like n=1 Tax=Haliotis cracherodii TaxID=6455 RepID=UPI0039EBEAA3